MAVLKDGSTGPEVEALQKRLKEEGFDAGLVDGEYGLGTEAAVIPFQKRMISSFSEAGYLILRTIR